MMPPCGTFKYAGVVPETEALRNSGDWQLEDRSGAPPLRRLEFVTSRHRDSLYRDRLVGLRPRIRISDGLLVLMAGERRRASVAEAGWDLDPSLLEQLRGGEVLTLVRTASANIGVSILRGGQLICAVGAVTVVPLGNDVAVRGGPEPDLTTRGWQWARADTWVDLSVAGQCSRLRDGEENTIGDYRAAVVHTFQNGLPGNYECVAITRNGTGMDEAAASSARLLARPGAGLWFKKW